MHGWRLAILIRNYWREAAIPASSLGSRSQSSRSFGRLSAVARNEEEAARAASSLARSDSKDGSDRPAVAIDNVEPPRMIILRAHEGRGRGSVAILVLLRKATSPRSTGLPMQPRSKVGTRYGSHRRRVDGRLDRVRAGLALP